MNCPVCHTSEIYHISVFTPWFYTDQGDIIFGEPYRNFALCRNGKYDMIEPGDYECVNGHSFEVEPEEEPQLTNHHD